MCTFPFLSCFSLFLLSLFLFVELSQVDVENPLYDYIPPEFVSLFVTNLYVVVCDRVKERRAGVKGRQREAGLSFSSHTRFMLSLCSAFLPPYLFCCFVVV